MFRQMRRHTQELSQENALEVLCHNTCGVLSVAGDEGYPYGVPVSYIYDKGKIYFHSARTGHKLDAIARAPKVSFTVVDQDEIVPEKFTTYFRSVIVFGQARILEDPEEKRQALLALSGRYCPGQDATKEIAGGIDRLHMIEITPDHITGKEAKELVNRRK